jgi:hypothetical protein
MATTYELIDSATVGSGGAASIDLTSIPSTYTDLVLKLSARQGSENAFEFIFNGSTSGYTTKRLQGDGSAASSNTASNTSTAIRVIGVNSGGSTANTFSNTEIYIPNYASANYKSISIDGVNEFNQTETYMNLGAGLWSNTAAINQITITPMAGSFVEYSSFYLYGIKNS